MEVLFYSQQILRILLFFIFTALGIGKIVEYFSRLIYRYDSKNMMIQILQISDDKNPEKLYRIKNYSNIVEEITYNSTVKDDLQIIEGVGPKIEALLNRQGIDTFKKLSMTSFQELSVFLRLEGVDESSIRSSETWPIQASIVAVGKIEYLKDFKFQLKNLVSKKPEKSDIK